MPDSSRMGPLDNQQSQRSVLRTLPFEAAQITSGFWAEYQKTNRDVSLLHGYAMLEQAGNFRNLRAAAGLEDGEFMGFWFADSDVYKWLEAVAWELGRVADSDLQKTAEEVIALVEMAQMPTGYLNSYFQIAFPEKRWRDLDHGHELYCAGHLIQAAIAFHRTLGDDRLITVALQFVDQIYDLFGPDGRDETGGHPEIETALVELYRVTADKRHLELAELFVDRRGRDTMRGHAGYGSVYLQDHVPVREADEVAGHAVRQLYLTTGVTDLYMETGEEALMDAMLTLWSDMTRHKLYVTGAVGSRFDGEAFGGPYELPSDTGYCETCAAIASVMWNWRLLLLTGDARYANLIEHTLYNSVLSSPGVEGASYLYVNPLQVRGGRYVRDATNLGEDGEKMRPAWHSCACCPPNVMRILSSLGHYLATASESGMQFHQYASARIEVPLFDGTAAIDVQTNYPWDGTVRFTVEESPAATWSLWLRKPEWCREFSVSINGQAVEAELGDSGYLNLEQTWQAGDTIVLHLRMEPQFIAPNPRIDALRGCVTLQRGPLVYCLESADQAGDVELLDIAVNPYQIPVVWESDLFGGMKTINLAGLAVGPAWDQALYLPLDELPQPEDQEIQLAAIPYFLWGNRGMKSMRVWIPTAASAAR